MQKLKYVIIIPSLNPTQKLISLVDELIDTKICRIVIVNDGSNVDCSSIFDKLDSYKDVVVLNHKTNLGKGAALKTAFSYCIENFKDCLGVVTAADDDQYKASDIIKVADEMESSQSNLILGVRPLNETNTSKRNYRATKTLSSVFKFLYNLNISDPRTALIGIPISELPWISKVIGKRYEFGVNMLIQTKRRNVGIKQVPIIIPSFKPNETSHYKTISDTVRIIALILFNLVLYSAASGGSIIIDQGTFFICNTFVFVYFADALRLFICTVIARTLSSLWDFSMNRKFFTKSGGGGQLKNQLFRYYILWFCQMMTSYTLLYLFNSVININTSILKGIIDIFLAIISYQVQLRFVFANTKSEKDSYGVLFKFTRWILKFFIKRLKVVGEIPSGPTVFIGHHQNGKGPLSVMVWYKEQLHIWMFDVFFERKSCFNQYYDYTFTKRLSYSKPLAYVFSFFSSFYVSRLAKSMKAIPVARSSMKSLEITIMPSVEALEKNEIVLIFPDIDYTNSSEVMGKLYTGFMNIDKYYFARNNEHVNFVPIKVDLSKGEMRIGQPSFAQQEDKFIQAKKRICDELIENFNLL